jgi:hypothetical protein
VPLAFDSLSHGRIAFGFFNIETDLILLERYYLFATDFCRYLAEAAAGAGKENWETAWEVYSLKAGSIGNLMGAIHGFDLRGFIGEVYRLFPFPQDPEGFKQNPEGYLTRSQMESILPQYGSQVNIPVRFAGRLREVQIGEYRFNQENFQELILYVWQGGFPRWRAGRRPEAVKAMARVVAEADLFPFERLKARFR